MLNVHVLGPLLETALSPLNNSEIRTTQHVVHPLVDKHRRDYTREIACDVGCALPQGSVYVFDVAGYVAITISVSVVGGVSRKPRTRNSAGNAAMEGLSVSSSFCVSFSVFGGVWPMELDKKKALQPLYCFCAPSPGYALRQKGYITKAFAIKNQKQWLVLTLAMGTFTHSVARQVFPLLLWYSAIRQQGVVNIPSVTMPITFSRSRRRFLSRFCHVVFFCRFCKNDNRHAHEFAQDHDLETRAPAIRLPKHVLEFAARAGLSYIFTF